jgi:hypothetical protein
MGVGDRGQRKFEELTHLSHHNVTVTSPNSIETLLRRLADDVARLYVCAPGALFIAFVEQSGDEVQRHHVKYAGQHTPKTITCENLIWHEGAQKAHCIDTHTSDLADW